MAVAAKTWTASYGRYVRLRITAQEREVDVPNNRSKVRVTAQIYYEGGTSAHNAYPQTYTITVNGTQIGRQTGITYSLSSGGTRNLTTYTSGWIDHNSNGSKTVTVRGHITDNAGDTATISQSYALTTIARASTLSSFSMPNHLKPGTTTTFNLGISRKSSSFTHDIQLRDGSTVIASWTGQGTPTTRSLTATQTNTLLKRMSSSTSRTMTLRVQTKSGSTNIGGALTRTATVYVHTDVRPSVSALSVTIEGNAHAKNTVKRFVQNISKVSGKFTRSATGGASISSSKLEIRRKSGGADLQTINSNSGTFPRVVALNGQYQARGTATDSRGRSSNTGWLDLSNFDVLAYSTPQITRFSTDRRTSAETTVDIRREGNHSALSGKNVLTIRLQKKASGATSWTNVVPDVTTTNAFALTVPSTGHSVASSYDFRLYIVDQFGNSAEQLSSVTTQRVVLDIHKNEGVGIGKIHERGVLDVNGEAFFDGELSLSHSDFPNNEIRFVSNTAELGNAGIEITANKPNGVGYIDFNTSRPTDSGGSGDVRFRATGGDNDDEFGGVLWIHAKDIDIRHNDTFKINGTTVINSGLNNNGRWIRFFDGTQICWWKGGSLTTTEQAGSIYRTQGSYPWTFPNAFSVVPQVWATVENANRWATTNSSDSVSAIYKQYGSANSTTSLSTFLYAIGRWR